MRRRAFTLFEVLIAIALIGMLAGSVFSFLWVLTGRRDLLHRRSIEAQATGAFIERLESDVLAGLAGDGAAGAGVSGTATTLKLLTRAVWLPAGHSDLNAAAADLQASEYAFEARSGVLRGRRWAIGAPGAGSPPEFEVISGSVQTLRLRYFDGEQWLDSFDSASADGLPVAIEVAIWLGDPLPAAEPAPAPAPGRPATPRRAESEAPPELSQPSPDALSASAAPSLPRREPDRLRLIVVPDGPVAPWKELR